MASSLYSGFSKAKAATRAAVLAGATAAFALGATGAVQPASAADNIPAACRKVSSDALPDCIFNDLKRREAVAKAQGKKYDAQIKEYEARGASAEARLQKTMSEDACLTLIEKASSGPNPVKVDFSSLRPGSICMTAEKLGLRS